MIRAGGTFMVSVNRALFFAFALWAASAAIAAGLEPNQVLIVVNKDTPVSAQVGRMYQTLRAIPPANVLSLSLGTERQITPVQYWAKAAPPVKAFLEANPEIRCIVTTSGVPYTIQATDGKDEGAAFDNELAAVLREKSGDAKRMQPNPLFAGGPNLAGINDPRRLQMVFVARLDGPDLKTITRMVEDAIATEKTGLDGPVYGDAQGLDAITGYGVGDASIRSSTDHFSGAGFVSKLDMKQPSWKQPKGGVGEQAAGAAFYMGWYDLLDFQDIFGASGLAKGSIAWHIASQEAQNIWDDNSRGWCVNLMRRGAAVTMGPVREPYVGAFPHGDIFSEALFSGESVAASYWLSLPHVSWAMVLLGDPMYRPFGVHARPTIVARAYLARNASGILRKNESSPLAVLLECIGPAGSTTPAMTATVEPDFGLAAASGTLPIPAMKAGETALVTIQSVTAGADPTGMFRLNLNAQDPQKQSRRIVLEGRIGFSRLTTGMLSKSQMIVSPGGDALISGNPGRDALIDPATLETKLVNPPEGLVILGGEFSDDAAHVALSLIHPAKKQSGAVIVDRAFVATQSLPAGSKYLRWLDKDHVLILSGGHVASHPIAGGDDYIFPVPSDWTSPLAGGSVIPETQTVYFTGTDGKMAFAKKGDAFREVLRGTRAIRFSAMANDLSLFGGVDSRKRLWIQRGVDADPEILATGVERVIWGPISHRAVVIDENSRGRIYDSVTRNWTDLGRVVFAQWSPDEDRLVFAGGNTAAQERVSLWDKGKIEELCDFARIGRLEGASIPTTSTKVFLLAGIGGQLDVWMMALPAPAAVPRP